MQEHVEANGFSVVREFVGHGIGTRLHEEPQVPNFGARGHGARLREGMVLAIEPMVNSGEPGTRVLDDKWTAVTADGSCSAHFEHCVAVTQGWTGDFDAVKMRWPLAVGLSQNGPAKANGQRLRAKAKS